MSCQPDWAPGFRQDSWECLQAVCRGLGSDSVKPVGGGGEQTLEGLKKRKGEEGNSPLLPPDPGLGPFAPGTGVTALVLLRLQLGWFFSLGSTTNAGVTGQIT